MQGQGNRVPADGLVHRVLRPQHPAAVEPHIQRVEGPEHRLHLPVPVRAEQGGRVQAQAGQLPVHRAHIHKAAAPGIVVAPGGPAGAGDAHRPGKGRLPFQPGIEHTTQSLLVAQLVIPGSGQVGGRGVGGAHRAADQPAGHKSLFAVGNVDHRTSSRRSRKGPIDIGQNATRSFFGTETGTDGEIEYP